MFCSLNACNLDSSSCISLAYFSLSAGASCLTRFSRILTASFINSCLAAESSSLYLPPPLLSNNSCAILWA
ncbi:hypothetical protein [Helicobacter pullorum]|uniref:hypothetical protein n=1 Tax=Helicobacter pullorum TaxID=35818 RepID=UPI001E36589D|nr:hypothetical protein [Helicobacter pullorum]